MSSLILPVLCRILGDSWLVLYQKAQNWMPNNIVSRDLPLCYSTNWKLKSVTTKYEFMYRTKVEKYYKEGEKQDVLLFMWRQQWIPPLPLPPPLKRLCTVKYPSRVSIIIFLVSPKVLWPIKTNIIINQTHKTSR